MNIIVTETNTATYIKSIFYYSKHIRKKQDANERKTKTDRDLTDCVKKCYYLLKCVMRGDWMNNNKKVILVCAIALLAICGALMIKGWQPVEQNDSTLVVNDAVVPSGTAVEAGEKLTDGSESIQNPQSENTQSPASNRDSNEKVSKKEKDTVEEKRTGQTKSSKNDKKQPKESTAGKKAAERKKTDRKSADTSDDGGSAVNEKSKNTGQNQKANPAPNTQAASAPPAVSSEEPAGKSECKLTVTCSEVFSHMDKLSESAKKVIPADGMMLQETCEFEEGDTAFDVLKRACTQKGILLDYVFTPIYSTYYIKGIGNLYEFDCGDESGWMYSVNGKNPGYGASQYKLSNGDCVVFYFTCELAQ